MSDPYIPPQQPGYTPPQPPPPPTPPQYGQQPPPPTYGQPQQPPPYAPPQPPQPPQYAAPPAAPYTQPAPYVAPGGPAAGGPPPAPKGNKGCLIAIVVVLVLFGIGGIAGVVGLAWLGNKVDDAVIGEGTGGQCPYVSNADATEALGTPATATYFDGIFKITNIADTRVLPDEPSCMMTQTAEDSVGMPGIGRAVKYTGGDAASRFQDELTKAKGITEDRGNGMSVSTDDYFNKDVTDLGDEAFCIKSSGILAGVVARQGDTLVYVGVAQASETGPGIDASDPDNVKLGTDDSACDASVVLARKILG